MSVERKFTLLPDVPDSRDYLFKAAPQTSTLPLVVDYRELMPPVVDQGYLGSCTANALDGFRRYLELKDGKMIDALSRLFIYYYERDAIGRISSDSGAYPRDGMKILSKMGAPAEVLWPYDQPKFAVKPPAGVEAPALKNRIAEYHRIETTDDMFVALAAGHAVVIGILLWESFYNTGSDGMVPPPSPATGDKPIGGHAMLACGYKTINGRKHPIVRNSWGVDWGDKGYCILPPECVLYINDMWTGVAKVTPDNFTFKTAVDALVQAGIFDSPDFWYAYYDKYQAGLLTNADAKFVDLAFRKFAADKLNNK